MKKFLVLFSVVCMTLSLSVFAFAGKAKTGDITINSDVDEINTIADGGGSEANANIHSVNVTDGQTGDITIKGKAKTVTTNASQGGKATTNIGNVKVGD